MSQVAARSLTWRNVSFPPLRFVRDGSTSLLRNVFWGILVSWKGPIRANAAWVVSAVALASCAPSGKVAGPDVRLPEAFESSVPASQHSELTSDGRWWDAFRDDQLSALIEEAQKRAPDARTALARLNEAYAIRSYALAAYNPQGALTAQGADQHTKTHYSGVNLSSLGSGSSGSLASLFLPADETKSYQGGFTASWEVDLFGRRKAARRTARADLLAARFEFEASRLALEANVATSLFQARALAVQLEDAQEQARISSELAKIGARKTELGLASGADQDRLDADAASSAAELVRLTALATAARRSLLVLIGRGAEATSSLSITAALGDPPPSPSVTPSEVLFRRPDVREAEQRLRSSIGTLTLDRLALLPTLTLSPGASWSHSEANFISKTSVWTIAASASAPVLDRPRLIGVARLQRAKAEEASVAYELAILNAYRDAENGLNQLEADRARLTQLRIAESKARRAFDSSRKAYDQGLLDLTTLLDAERSWRGARSALTGLKASALIDAVTTVKALGGGWSGTPPKVKG